MPVRAGTLWDGVHFEVPVGNAVAVWRLISQKCDEEKRNGRPSSKVLSLALTESTSLYSTSIPQYKSDIHCNGKEPENKVNKDKSTRERHTTLGTV